ncbi:M24 family metallopeptidase [Halosolutus gelatinilyticus]|uniref:M24 family metallopeptidase n=1 Tax=Halosolutus gelatinilyticus TaxID=2931975 RepID=UPI001FF519F4|nr:Xaa-Pro peptidase family protein [Halosolutus gelatinilyticus]
MRSVFESRLAATRRRLAAVDADLAVCFPSPNLTYLVGFDESPSERHLLLFVPTDGPTVLLAPTMYEAQLDRCPIDELRLWDDDEEPLAVLERTVSDLGFDEASGEPPTVLVDDRMWATFTQDLRSALPRAEFGLASAAIEPLRLKKDDVELDALERAGAIADRVSVAVRSRGRDLVGLTEAELAAEIDRLLTAEGGDEPAFETIVASGPNGASPHHHGGQRRIEPGDPIVLDFGTTASADLEDGTGRYPSDQTRTVVVGEPSAEFEHVHEIVRDAQEAAVDAVEPGVAAAEIDRVARDVIDDAGYADAFIHRTGHGVGLEVHEPPYIAAGTDRELEPGMVFSVEPGIYLDGAFGVRIEDLVVVTDDGADRLNDSPRGWKTGDRFDAP